jgi:hypothetical protein
MKKIFLTTLMLSTALSFQNAYTADVAQEVVMIGATANERTPLPANQVAELRTQLTRTELNLNEAGLQYTIDGYILILYPINPATGTAPLRIMDATHLADTGELRMLTGSDADFKILQSLVPEFDTALFDEVQKHPDSKKSTFINATHYLDGKNQTSASNEPKGGPEPKIRAPIKASRSADKENKVEGQSQEVFLVGSMTDKKEQVPASEVAALKEQLKKDGLVLDGDTLSYTIGTSVVMLSPRNPKTGNVIIHIMDASHLPDKREIKMINENNDQEYEAAKPLIEKFTDVVVDEVQKRPASAESTFINASGLLDKANK